MKKLLFVFILQLFCIGAFSQTVDIIGEDYVVAGSTHSGKLMEVLLLGGGRPLM